MSRPPKILVFDSGLGGLTVFAEVARLRPDADFVYAADDAGFPYGALPETALAPRVLAVIERLIEKHAPDIAVIACNTASTLVLPHLRAAFPNLPFVGTVPAIKPAAIQSRTKMISVLATPGTVARDYTRELVRAYAANCSVTLVGSTALAGLAEDFMQGATPSDEGVSREIAPAFVEAEGAGPIASFSPARIIRFSSPNWSASRHGQSNGSTPRRPSRGAPIRSCATRLAFPQAPEPNLYERRRRCLRTRNCRGRSFGPRCADFGIEDVNLEPMPLVFA